MSVFALIAILLTRLVWREPLGTTLGLVEVMKCFNTITCNPEECPAGGKVERILAEMSLGETDQLTVFNKADRLADGGKSLSARKNGPLCISALNAETCRPLLENVAHRLWRAGRE